MTIDLSKAKKMCLGADAFECMDSLRLLDVFFFPVGAARIELPDDGLDTLPNELRWLEWIGFPSRCLPSTFCPEKLVVLSLRHSNIERCWGGVEPTLVNLIALNLSYCLNLIVVPNLSGCKKLELLRLKGCRSLVQLPSHVQDLDKLIEVDLSECLNLMHLPAKLNSKCLKYVRLAKCPKLILCPEINNAGDLEVLDLEGTPVTKLPCATRKVKNGNLRLCGKCITSFPRISTSLKLLRLCHTTMEELDVDHHQQQDAFTSSELLPKFNQVELVGNSQLVALPNSIWDMVKKEIWIEDCSLIVSLPDISNRGYGLTGVYVVNCGNLKSLPSGISNLKLLRVIHCTGTAIQSLPSDIHLLDNLCVLNLSFCVSLQSIPDNINELVKLFQLSLKGCVKIQSLPELLPPNLEVFCVSGCKSLQALPSNTVELNLSLLRFENCPRLDSKLPDQITVGFPKCAAMSMQAKGSVLYSGSSELPEWCSNCNVSYDMELPPLARDSNQPHTLMFKGIAFGVVFSSDAIAVELNMKCKVEMGGTVVATFSSHAIRICGGSGTSSDYVFLWFDKKVLGETQKGTEDEEEEEEVIAVPWYVRYAGQTVSFRVYCLSKGGEDVEKVKNMEVKRLGVSLVY